MTEARQNIFDMTVGIQTDRTWLDSKVMRREMTEDLCREGLTRRAEMMGEASNSFREDLNERAARRDGLAKRSEESRRRETELMQRKAEEYREKLRKKLRGEERQ